jgi:hypothetical protein
MDQFMEMAILKNDLGELNQYKFNWVGKTGSITEMDEHDENKYNDYMSKKDEVDNPSDDDKGYKKNSKWDL